mgnify:CR=1 FL=1
MSQQVGKNGQIGDLLKIKDNMSEDQSESGMIGGLFYSRVHQQVQEHKEDRSKAAIQLKSYMAYLKDDDQQSKGKKHAKKNEKVTEENEDEVDNDTSRGLLLLKGGSDSAAFKSNKVHFAPPADDDY